MKEDKIISQPLRVLLVEDDSADQTLAKHALARSTYGSFEFNCTDTLQKGIEFAASGPIDVILLDLNLPDSSGVETFQKINFQVPKIPIVVLSGVKNQEESLKAVRLGAQDYLIKDHIEGDLLGRSLIYAIERKKAEIKLLESEENFRNSMNNSPMGIRIVDQNWSTVYANPVILNMLGYKNINEVPRNPLYAHYTAQERERAKVRGEKLAKGEPLQTDIEVDIIDKGGTILHLQVFLKNTIWNGEPHNLLIYNDITKGRLAEEALKKSQEQYRILVDNANEAIVVAQDDRLKYANKTTFELFPGYSKEELFSRAFTDFVYPDDRVRVIENFKRRITHRLLSSRNDYRLIMKDGSVKWAAVGSALIEWEGRPATLNFISDIDSRKRAEETLEQSERNFRNSMDQSSIGIRISDKKGNNLYANQALLDIFGYENRAEIQIKQPQEFYSPECYAVFLQRHERFLRGEQMPKRVEIDIIRKDGAVRNLQVSMMDVFWNGSIQYQTLYNDVTDLKQTERALQESEEKYRLIVEKSTDIIFSFNAAGEFLYVSPSIKNLLGYDPVELIGHPFQSLVHPADIPVVEQAIHRNIKDGSQAPGGNRFRVRNALGEWRWHSATGNAEYDASGKFEYFIAISRDITEHKKAEELLQATEQNFRNSLDASPVGIRIIDTERRNLYANQEFLNIFGYHNMGEVGGYPLQDHYTSEEHAKFLSREEERAHGGTIPNNMMVEIKSKDGIIRYLEVSDSEVVWDGKPQREIIYKDVTESELAKKALQESEERYRLIVENSRDTIFTVNTKEEFAYVSSAITMMLGYNPVELIGNKFISFVHPEDRQIIIEETRQSYLTGYNIGADKEYRMRHASGEWRWVTSGGNRVVNKNGDFLYFIGVLRDITEHKQSEKEKQAMAEKAQVASRLAAIGEMAAGIAHEINNPLTGVIGFSQILLEKENVPEDIKSELIVIADGSQRVADIVRRLLTFARQTKPKKTLTNINELVNNTLKLREYVLNTANIKTITKYEPDLPWSVVDPGQMQQVFLNLIVNAEQAMEKSHGRGTLTISTEKKGNTIRVLFQDDGPGISKENMKRLFEPFFTTKEVGQGTGLGLSLSRSIVLEHGGNVSVESEFGHGAIFTVEIPIVEEAPIEADVQNKITQKQPSLEKNTRILVIDDEPGVRLLLEKVLTPDGYRVEVVPDAETALSKLDAGDKYDVILLDIRMPGVSGAELYSRILDKDPTLGKRIIIITGDVMGADIKEFLVKHNLPFLSKPFDMNLLKEQVASMVAAKEI